MRATLIVLLVALVGIGLFFLLRPTSAPSDVEAAKITDLAATSTPSAATTTDSTRQAVLTKFQFTGYGPGKEHPGTFKETSVVDVAFDANGIPEGGRFVIKTASVDTGIAALDKHLCSEDFFNCAENPEIVFALKSVAARAGGTYDVTGSLTFNDVTKEITFPATSSADGKFSADFKFDTTFFNFKYTAIDKEVRIQFEGEVR